MNKERYLKTCESCKCWIQSVECCGNPRSIAGRVSFDAAKTFGCHHHDRKLEEETPVRYKYKDTYEK